MGCELVLPAYDICNIKGRDRSGLREPNVLIENLDWFVGPAKPREGDHCAAVDVRYLIHDPLPTVSCSGRVPPTQG